MPESHKESIFSRDVNSLKDEQIPPFVEMGLLIAKGEFSERKMRQLNAKIAFMAADNVAKKVFDDFTYDQIGFEMEFFNEMREEFGKNRESHEQLILEKSFLDMHSSFELFLSQNLEFILWCLPTLFLSKNEGRNMTQKEFHYFFANSNILLARRALIESKVTQWIAVLSIEELPGKIKGWLGIEISFSQEDIKSLTKASIFRNVIVHNEGEINEIAENRLRKNGMLEFHRSQKIAITDDYLEQYEETLTKVVDSMHKQLRAKIPQMITYAAALKSS